MMMLHLRRATAGTSVASLPWRCAVLALAAALLCAPVSGARTQAPALSADMSGMLDPVIAIARHGDLRDVAFIERTLKVALTPREEWRGADNAVAGYWYGPTRLPYATGRSSVSLLIRTPPTVFAPTGEYEVGRLLVQFVDMASCVGRQDVEQRLVTVFGSKLPVVINLFHPSSMILFKAIEDKDRIVYVNARFTLKPGCLVTLDVLHRL